MSEESRKHVRAAIALKVKYRTAGSFLVSYSINLSRGGLFFESAQTYPIGTALTLKLGVPGVADEIETPAKVVWVRKEHSADGPPGVGVAFEGLDQQIGAQIDEIVRQFEGLILMAFAGEAAACQRLQRHLASIISCKVNTATTSGEALASLSQAVDLVLVDLDTLNDGAINVFEAALSGNPPIPVIVLCRDDALSERARKVGAVVLTNPPPPELLRQTLLEVLSRPHSN